MIAETKEVHSQTAIINSCSGSNIHGTLICSDPSRAEILKTLVCSNCKNPIESCGLCGRKFRSRDKVHCTMLNVHYCERCVKTLKKSYELQRPKKSKKETPIE